MTPDREMIIMAVLDGKLPESMLTKSEIDEVVILAQEATMIKKMEELEAAGKSVFWGVDGGDTLQ
jgi:glycerol-3-phosphate responsive antiterminator